MDDVGAASKRHEIYGITRIPLGRWRVPFPGNFLWLKYLPGIKRWGRYAELAASEWRAAFQLLADARAHLTVAVTAAWVEDDGALTPYAQRFPEAAAALRDGVAAGLVEIANHGLTHCLLRDGAFRPRAFAGNRSFHREFYDFIPPDEQRAHIARAQDLLTDAFKTEVVTFVPPGNLLQRATLEAARDVGLRFASFRAPTSLDGPLPVIGDERGVAFHDRDIVLGGVGWLESLLSARRGVEILQVKELGARLLREAAGRPA
jgi:hypothetical protein